MDDRDTPATGPLGEPSDGSTATRPDGHRTPAHDFSLAAPEGGIRRLPEHIGPFRVVGVLGVGGMGVVYDAEQDHPRRRVALKVIRDAMLHPDGLRRFAREAEVLGRLQHPGIAQVYATGVADGPHGPQPYFAMERVSGEPLGRYAERLDRRARLGLFARVCDAVHYAHQRGVIHRDLKPANVLVDAAGAPKVLDFGVARLTDADVQGTLAAPGAATAVTATGEVVGTLFYMSPEQLRGDALAIDTRTDVYALGVILYELLAGRRPHEPSGGAMFAAAHAILATDAPPLGTLDRGLRGDLETIAAKALEKEPARRYASAAGLAGDVRRYLADEPITARPASAAYQLRKLARRHRAAVAAASVALVALAAGAVASAWGAVRARAAERVAVAQRGRAEAALGLAERRRGEAAAALALAEQRRGEAEADRARADQARREALGAGARALASADQARREAARAGAEAARATAVGGFLEQMLTSADPSVARGRELTVREVLDSAARRVNAPGPLTRQPAARAAALATLAASYDGLGLYPPARQAAESAYAIQRRLPTPDARALAQTARQLGLTLNAAGDYPGSERRYREALALVRGQRPVDVDQEARLLTDLGGLMYVRQNIPAAESLHTAALAIARARHRPADAFVADRLLARAQIYAYTDRPGLAEPDLREALALYRAAYGPTHPDVARALNALAFARTRTADAAGAETLLRESLAVSRRLYGVGPHPRTADVLDRLGSALAARQRFAEAEPVQREALAMRLAVLGAGHADVQYERTELARTLSELGRLSEADTLLTQALAGRRALLGSAHPAVASSMLDLGLLARRRGDLTAAERAYAEAATTFAATGDPANAAHTRLELASLLVKQGRVADALRAQADARAELRAAPTVRSNPLVVALAVLAEDMETAGRPAVADTLATDALAMRRAIAAANHPTLVVSLLTLATIRARAGDTTRAAPLVREAQGITAAWQPPGSRAVTIRSLRLGEALCAMGRTVEGAGALRGVIPTLAPADSAITTRVQRSLAGCGAVGPAPR